MSLSQTNLSFLTCSFLLSSNELRSPYSRVVLSYPHLQTHWIFYSPQILTLITIYCKQSSSFCFFSKPLNFQLSGFISEEALLHGVETRTSSPVRIPRSNETYESTSLKGLYRVGEGAGYAGGIVSSVVDGIFSGFVVAKSFDLFDGTIESVIGMVQGVGTVKY